MNNDKKVIRREIEVDFSGRTVDTIITDLTRLCHTICSPQDTFHVSKKWEYGEQISYTYISYQSLETDEEYNARIKEEELRTIELERAERKALKRLLKKYGDK